MSDKLLIKIMKWEMALRRMLKTGCSERGSWIWVAYGIVTVATTAVSAYGQYKSGKAQDTYYKALADQNDREADMARETAEQQTDILQNEAAQKSKELGRDVSVVKGSQRAAMAAMGIYGVTAEDIIGDTTNKAKLDEANIRYNADINSYVVKRDASEKGYSLRNQAGLFRMAGRSAKQAANINMTTTILGGASSILGGFAFGGGGGVGKPAVAGQGGYGANTPQGVTNMGSWSKWTPTRLS